MTFELAHKAPVRSGGRAHIVSGRKLTGQKPALKMKEVMAIRIRLQKAGKIRELALFNLGIDSKLRGCDLVRLRVEDVAVAGTVKNRAAIVQKKTGRPVQFEITDHTLALNRDPGPRAASNAARAPAWRRPNREARASDGLADP